MAKMKHTFDNWTDARNAFVIGRRNKDGNVTLGNNTVLVERTEWTEDGEVTNYAVRLHNTDIVTFKSDGRIVLNSGGFYSRTTADRMNQFVPWSMRVRRSGGEFILDHIRNGTTEMGRFVHTMTVL